MKKLYLLLPLLLLATSCDETSSESSSVSVSDSFEVVDNSESSMQALIEQELNVIKNSPAPTSIRDSLYIKKDGKTYYEIFERKEHDKLHGYHYYYQEEKGLSDLNNPSSSYVTSSTVYYDGYYSYTLGSDDRYTKVEDERKITDLEFGFDFSVLENVSVEAKGYSYELTATISKENANKFLGTTGKEIESINFISTSNGGRFLGFEITYEQNGFSVERELQYSYSDIEFELPTSQFIK